MRTDGPPVTLIGAYQRENFGDILFLHLSREYLGAPAKATAPMPAAASPHLTEPVTSYVPVLREGDSSGVWVVGGEIGRAAVLGAYRTSVDAKTVASLPTSTRARDIAVMEATGLPWYASPYLPRLSAYPASSGVPLVINSVGMRHLSRWPAPRAEVLAALQDAEYLSVREDQSSQFLDSIGVSHTRAPDLVHTIAKRHPELAADKSDVALIQVNERTLRPFGAARFAEVLANARSLAPFRLRLFTAGSAVGHDSAELYKEVAKEFQRIRPGRTLEWSTSITPWEKVSEIASAGLWMGTSLHGSIISTAFGTPRVGLELEKLANYADSWADPMPSGVDLSDIDSAIDASLSVDKKAEHKRATALADLAEKSVHACVQVLRDGESDAGARAERRRKQEISHKRRGRSPFHVASHIYRKFR